MKKTHVTYNIGILLKSLGFNDDCNAWYSHNSFFLTDKEPKYYETDPLLINNKQIFIDTDCLAPKLVDVLNWFKTKYNIHVLVNLHDSDDKSTWRFEVKRGELMNGGEFLYISPWHNEMNNLPKYFKNKKEAIETAIFITIALIKSNNYEQIIT